MSTADREEHSFENRATYDRIAVRYLENQRRLDAGNERHFGELEDRFLQSVPANAVVADLGCGPGLDVARFAAHGNRVIGLDLSFGMLSIASRTLGRFAQADLRQLPIGNGALDGIWSVAALLHVAQHETETVLEEMRRVLRPGATLAIVTATGGSSFFESVPYAEGEHRWFIYRDPALFLQQLRRAGFVVSFTEQISRGRPWLTLLASAE